MISLGTAGVTSTRDRAGFGACRPARRADATPRPQAGLRPTVQFAIAAALTAGWVGFAVWASGAVAGQLEAAIGPVMAWVIPILLAYIPGLVIGFMIFTLLVNPLPRDASCLSQRALACRASGRR